MGRGGTVQPRPPGYQPANPAPDGATRGNLARTGANFGGRQDGAGSPACARRGVSGTATPRGVAPTLDGEPFLEQRRQRPSDEANEPDQTFDDPMLRRRRHISRLPHYHRRPTSSRRRPRPSRLRPQGPPPGDLAGARRRHQPRPSPRPQRHAVQLHRIAGDGTVLAAAAAGPA